MKSIALINKNSTRTQSIYSIRDNCNKDMGLMKAPALFTKQLYKWNLVS